MSHLHINLVIDERATALTWQAAICYRLQALADYVAAATGPLEVREDWPDLEGWPQVVDTYTGPPLEGHPRTLVVTLTGLPAGSTPDQVSTDVREVLAKVLGAGVKVRVMGPPQDPAPPQPRQGA